MSFRTASEIRTSAITLLDGRGSGIRTETGEPINDLIDAFSLEAERLNVVAQYLELMNSIPGWRQIVADDQLKIDLAAAFGISSITLDADFARRIGAPVDIKTDIEALLYVDLNRYAASLGRPRSPGVFASGVLTIFLANDNPVTYRRGAGVQTGGDTGILYDTVTDLIGVTPSFNTTRNLNFVTIGIRARSVGIRANQIIGAVNSAITPFVNSVAILNESPVQNGLDRETNDILLNALEGVLGGTDVNTRQGLINFVESQPNVADAAVIGPGNPLMVRSTAGAVDLYVIGADLVTDTVGVQVVVEGEDVVLPLQPVRQINSVIGAAVYTEGGGFVTPEGSPSVFATSAANGLPDLQWQASPAGPIATEIVTINFTYNNLIRRIQRLFDEDPDREVPGSDLLVKEATRLGISAEMKVIPLPGFTQVEAEGAATAALSGYVDTLLLGSLLEYSDALTAISTTTVEGVLVIDRIDGFVIGVTGSALGVVNVPTTEIEYTRMDAIVYIAP